MVYEPLIVLEMLKERDIQNVQRRTGSELNVSVSSLFARAEPWFTRASKLLFELNAFWDPSARADNGWARANKLLDAVARANPVEARANEVLDASTQPDGPSLERT